MKNLVLAIALVLSLAGVSVAGTGNNATNAVATASARHLANALELNEAAYLKIKKIEIARLEALQGSTEDATTIQENYTVAILQLLTPAQQKAYRALTNTQLVQHNANTK